MNVQKAVITAAARGGRLYPVADTVQKAMLPLLDIDGLTKPVIQIIAEEALAAGIEEICLVCAPGDAERYEAAFQTLGENLLQAHAGKAWAEEQATRIQSLVEKLSFQVQEETKGYGHAVLCAREFVGEEPFLLLLGDHVYRSALPAQRCAKQLVEVAKQEGRTVSGVNPTPEHLIGKFGTLAGRPVPLKTGLYEVDKILEKPSLSQAELELHMPGLRMGFYLCIFGMHVLTSEVFDILADQFAAQSQEELLLTPALQDLAEQGNYLALELQGSRYDLSAPLGWWQAQLALGLAGQQSEAVLADLVSLMADFNRSS